MALLANKIVLLRRHLGNHRAWNEMGGFSSGSSTSLSMYCFELEIWSMTWPTLLFWGFEVTIDMLRVGSHCRVSQDRLTRAFSCSSLDRDNWKNQDQTMPHCLKRSISFIRVISRWYLDCWDNRIRHFPLDPLAKQPFFSVCVRIEPF